MRSIIEVNELVNTNHNVKTGFFLIIKNKIVPFLKETEIIYRSSNKDGLNEEIIYVLRRDFEIMMKDLEYIVKQKHCSQDGDIIRFPDDYIINIT